VRRFALAMAAGLALVLGGCGVIDRQPVIVAGLSIGAEAGCGACDQPQTSADCGACDSIAQLAAHHLEMEDPGHPAVAATSFFAEGPYCCGPSGDLALWKRSAGLVVAVVTFVDGTRHAVAVSCGVGGCR
jgi:hypothetical protein